jgi:hypothetical protein
MSGRGWELTPEEVASALEEAKVRGLPGGWTVTLDVSQSVIRIQNIWIGIVFSLTH